MNLYRRVVLTKLITLLLFTLPAKSYGHGGGLNNDGCHTYKKTNDYHCHQKYGPTSPASHSEQFDRNSFGFKTYKASTSIGFYTQKQCNTTHIDHVVSLKDAWISSAYSWSKNLKRQFANDRENHRPACAKVNISKSASIPSDFLRKSNDGKGIDYHIVRFCDYLYTYYKIKEKYHLSTDNNVLKLRALCNE